jgi:AcrR family transcriptional regulator
MVLIVVKAAPAIGRRTTLAPIHDWDRTPTAAEARQWQLLAAGRKAILERGFDSLTVDDVVAIAGIAKGSFYTYFSSREAFLDRLRVALAEDIGEAVHQASVGPWVGLFGRMMRAARDWLIANEQLRALFGPTYMADPHRATRDPLEAVLAAVLRSGIEAGVLHPTVLPEVDPVETGAQMALDVMREAAAREASMYPDDAPIAAAEEFLASAFHLDTGAAAHSSYTPGGLTSPIA